jgi:hypothetical protein
MYYIALMWLIVLASVLFTAYFKSYSSIGKSQMYADLIADGTAYAGNNGWGLDEKAAKNASRILIQKNKKAMKDISPEITYSSTDSNGKKAALAKGENKNNTVNVKARLKTLVSNQSIEKTKKASTRITYSGGLKVVKEAYKHSYEYNPASQTYYFWGGGHGADDESWEQNADCSGFVSGVFRKCGYYIPSSACTGDMESMGELVGVGDISVLSKANPGDIILIWWSNAAGSSDHVGIYAGEKNGVYYMIHSRGGPTRSGGGPERGVHITVGPYSAAKVMVRRIVDTTATVAKVTISNTLPNGMTRYEGTISEGLQTAGYGKVQIAAILGNFSQESGNYPYASEAIQTGLLPGETYESYAKKIQNGYITKEDWLQTNLSHTGYGIVQWSWTKDDHARKPGLWDYAQSVGSNVTDIYVQTQYLILEMTNGSQSAFFNDSHFRSLTDVQEATKYFCETFERAGIPNLSNRILQAQKYYQKLISG